MGPAFKENPLKVPFIPASPSVPAKRAQWSARTRAPPPWEWEREVKDAGAAGAVRLQQRCFRHADICAYSLCAAPARGG